MKTKHFLWLLFCFFVVVNSSAKQKETELINWEQVDFNKHWKIKAKIPGAVSKSLTSSPTFIQNYVLDQATVMKGSASSSSNSSLFSGASLGGVSAEAIQKLSDELYADFYSKLEKAGLTMTAGDEVVGSDYAQDKKDDKQTFVGKTDGEPIVDKLNGMQSYNTREKMYVRPEGINMAYNYNLVKSGLFNQNLSKKTKTNLIQLSYIIGFASFDGDKGYKGKLYLTTKPGLTISPSLNIINPKGAWGSVYFEDAISANNNWSKGIEEIKSKDGSWLGLSSSADYALNADEDLYIAELKAAIMALQTAMVNALAEELK
jgi:hypothetical protein